MPMARTQIYLPEDLRARVDERALAEGKTMAEVVRAALERYVTLPVDLDQALDSTFGSVPRVVVPSRDDWDRG
jgi:hypothetical protein